jgi:hypothetical protein
MDPVCCICICMMCPPLLYIFVGCLCCDHLFACVVTLISFVLCVVLDPRARFASLRFTRPLRSWGSLRSRGPPREGGPKCTLYISGGGGSPPAKQGAIGHLWRRCPPAEPTACRATHPDRVTSLEHRRGQRRTPYLRCRPHAPRVAP